MKPKNNKAEGHDGLTASFWEMRDGYAMLRIWAKPGARKEAVLGTKADEHGKLWLHLAVKAAPEDGKANAAIIAFLAEALDVRQSTISLMQGAKSKQKVFRVDGVNEEKLTALVYVC